MIVRDSTGNLSVVPLGRRKMKRWIIGATCALTVAINSAASSPQPNVRAAANYPLMIFRAHGLAYVTTIIV